MKCYLPVFRKEQRMARLSMIKIEVELRSTLTIRYKDANVERTKSIILHNPISQSDILHYTQQVYPSASPISKKQRLESVSLGLPDPHMQASIDL